MNLEQLLHYCDEETDTVETADAFEKTYKPKDRPSLILRWMGNSALPAYQIIQRVRLLMPKTDGRKEMVGFDIDSDTIWLRSDDQYPIAAYIVQRHNFIY
jgi:hypothetical protein